MTGRASLYPTFSSHNFSTLDAKLPSPRLRHNLRKNNLVECQKVLFDFLQKEDYDEKKVQTLTAIIWLNMAPLHHYPFNIFLYYFGKLHLWRAINETNKQK